MKPLDGIRVIDFTRVVAGPLATRVLADQGADVIKVEPPEGDMTRGFPPLGAHGITPYFAHQNAGKRFCSMDLSAPGATDVVYELLEHCDVLIENYRPGVMARLGLGPDEVLERFPSLVYCSVTGFGQSGPWADRRAYAPIGHLESGLLAYDHLKTGRPARQPALTLGDASAAMMAANSINAMLVQVARTGRGGHLDVCMVESLLFLQEWASTELAGGCEGTNAGACDECPILVLPSGDVWGIAGNPIAWFEHLVGAMGRPELLDDPRFADPEAREEHRADVEQLLVDWAATFPDFDAFRDHLESNSPFTTAPLHSIHDLAESDFAAHRELFTSTNNGMTIPSRPAGGAGIGTNGRVAGLGADNAAVLGSLLGYDDRRIAELRSVGVLSQ